MNDKQGQLFQVVRRPHGEAYRFGGTTMDRTTDEPRLNRQLRAVSSLMKDGCWRTLAEIAEATGAPEASVSARLRDLRKEHFGGHTVNRRRCEPESGLHEYQVKENKP